MQTRSWQHSAVKLRGSAGGSPAPVGGPPTGMPVRGERRVGSDEGRTTRGPTARAGPQTSSWASGSGHRHSVASHSSGVSRKACNVAKSRSNSADGTARSASAQPSRVRRAPWLTENAVAEVHALLEGFEIANLRFEIPRLPAAVFKPACEQCSVFETCLPKATGGDGRAQRLARALFEI